MITAFRPLIGPGIRYSATACTFVLIMQLERSRLLKTWVRRKYTQGRGRHPLRSRGCDYIGTGRKTFLRARKTCMSTTRP